MDALESLLRVFVESHPDEAAHALETLGADEVFPLFISLPMRSAAPLLERLTPQTVGLLVARLDARRVGELISAMPPRAASVMLQQIDAAKREEVLAGLKDHVASPLRELGKHSSATAGGIMEPRVAALAIDLSVEEAIAVIRKTPREALHYLYVTGRDGQLAGVLTMRDLLLAAPHAPIEPLVRRNVTSVSATMDRQEVVNVMTERGFLALPVVDFDGRLIGVVKRDDALEAGQMEAFEDLQKISGAGADERALSPVRVVVRSRLPWLLVNLATAFLAAAVVGLFEGIIEQVAALAVLLPVVAGQGGNTGAQSLAVVIRGLALREIITGTRWRVVIKECAAGLVNGVLIALVTSLAVLVWQLTLAQATTSRAMGLSIVIGLAMVIDMAAAAFSGAVIPLGLKVMGFDPAQSSSIFLTTVTDIVGFASFLGFAVLFLPMLT